MIRSWLAVAAAAACAGCTSDLPAASFIDKLRVLAVKANEPEIKPGDSTVLSVLAVEPPKNAGAVLDLFWSACALPPSGVQVNPCGIGSGAGVSGVEVLPVESCPLPDGKPEPGPMRCSSYTARADLLGSASSTEVLLTVVVADRGPGSAQDCVAGIVSNNGLPTEPDHCVVSIKRLAVSTAPSNHNPALADFSATAPHGMAQPLDPGTGTWSPAAKADGDEWTLIADRADGSAERKSDGTYEALSLSWFTTAGHLDGGRSIYLPPGCNDPAACATQEPEQGASTSWFAPTAAQAQTQIGGVGAVDFWAVIRDDRGGVDWRAGRLVPATTISR
jgi:hypothetical protein